MQKGFATVIVIAILLIIAAVGAGAYYIGQKSSQPVLQVSVENLSTEKKATPTPEVPREYTIVTLYKRGGLGTAPTSNTEVINDSKSWESLRKRLYPNSSPQNPTVDINKETVIRVSVNVMTGGYNIEIIRIEDLGDKVKVTAVKTSPGENCFVTKALESHSHIVKTEKINKEVVFDIQEVVRDCKR